MILRDVVTRWPGKSPRPGDNVCHPAVYHMLDVAAVAEQLIAPIRLPETRASGSGSPGRLARSGQDKCRLSVDVDGKREPKERTSLGSDRGASYALRRPFGASWSRTSAKMGALRRDCRPSRTSSDQGQGRLVSDVPCRRGRSRRRCRHPGLKPSRRCGPKPRSPIATRTASAPLPGGCRDWLPRRIGSAQTRIGSRPGRITSIYRTTSIRPEAKAREAVRRAGLDPVPPSDKHLFDWAPRPMQEAAAAVPIPEGPMLAIIEDGTGSGKDRSSLDPWRNGCCSQERAEGFMSLCRPWRRPMRCSIACTR